MPTFLALSPLTLPRLQGSFLPFGPNPLVPALAVLHLLCPLPGTLFTSLLAQSLLIIQVSLTLLKKKSSKETLTQLPLSLFTLCLLYDSSSISGYMLVACLFTLCTAELPAHRLAHNQGDCAERQARFTSHFTCEVGNFSFFPSFRIQHLHGYC